MRVANSATEHGVARVVVVVLVLFASAIGAVAASMSARAVAGGSATAPAGRRHVVEVRGFAFHPAVVEAAAGDTVVWVNRDVVPHTATAHGSEWDTGDIAAGASAVRVVSTGDVAEYFCLYHPSMKGKLIVRRDGGPPSQSMGAAE